MFKTQTGKKVRPEEERQDAATRKACCVAPGEKMEEVKNFFTLFRRFEPTEEQREVLKGAGNIRRKVDKEKRVVIVRLAFGRTVPKQTLYAIEEGIRKAYDLNSVFLMPEYPAECFTKEYFREIVKEAQRTGVIAKGFFEEYTYDFDREKIQLYLPWGDGGISILERGKITEVLEKIIQSEFALECTVKIKQTKTSNEEYADYAADQRKRLQELMKSGFALQAKQQSVATMPEKAEEQEKKLPRAMVVKGEAADAQEISSGVFKVGNLTLDVNEPELIFGGEEFKVENPTAICHLDRPMSGVTVIGHVDSYEKRLTKGDAKIIMTIGLTDYLSSVNVRIVVDNDEEGQKLDKLISKSSRTIRRGVQTMVTVYNLSLAVMGNLKTDKYDGELYLEAKLAEKIKRVKKTDNAPVKRVELHLHTNLSTMDALIIPEFLVETVQEWGWDTVAVTDHGNVQSYPLMLDNTLKTDLKVLYGMEAYFVDDTARAAYGSIGGELGNTEFVIFDIETTGLSVANCAITEIGAVKYRNGKINEKFSTFANPGGHIPRNITELTGITDEMVKDAPSQEAAVRAFMAFAGDSILVAHNANFDTGFIRNVCEQYKIPFANSFIDTVPLSKYLNPDLRKHKLDILAEHYGLGDFNHHRAFEDAEMLGLIFDQMCSQLKKEGVNRLEELASAMSDKADPKKLPTYHMILFAKNLIGLKNLYKIISMSYLDYYHRVPRIPKTVLDNYREGLIVGSACEAGQLYRAILEKQPADVIKNIAEYYDYLEIQPLCNNRFLIAQNMVSSDEELMDINRRICRLGEELHKPVVATCDVHFLKKEDEIYRQILQKGMKYQDADRETGLYLRTTDEMLEEFAYLGKEKAYEVVVTNPRAIADSMEKIRPIPDGTFTPKMEGAEDDLQNMCWQRAKDMYEFEGVIPDQVSRRLDKELKSIISNGFAVLYMIAQKLVWFSEKEGYLVGSRGSVGSSFVATMAGISEVNPLPPHYRCPHCRYSEFVEDGSVGSGFDMPDKNCPHCGNKMTQDGQDIPFETFLGFHGDKSPDIDLNFSGEVQGRVHKYTEDLFGHENVFKAGTLGTLASKTAYGYVMKYLDEKGISANRAEINRLVNGCVGVKRTTGQHPGGIVVIPREYDVYDFTPVQHPADDPNSDIVTTHFAFAFLHDTILKLDELGHDIPTKYKWLERYTGQSVMDVPMNAPEVYELFTSLRPLGLKKGDIDADIGTYGLPEFGTRFAQKMLEEAQPKSFADLLQISGLSHGTDVWTGNAQDLIRDGICSISEVVATRDSIMLTLIRYGLDNAEAFKIMESVRKGKGLTPDWEAHMREHGVPDWYIGSCKKIKYMFPKAHAAAYVMSAIRLGWFKIHRPLEFYAAYFSVAPDGFDGTVVSGGKEKVRATMREIDERIKNKTDNQKDKDTQAALQLVLESMARGIEYLPVHLYKSDAKRFLPENGKIRMPFNCLPGLGESAAEKIVQAREEGEFFSKLELQERSKAGKSVIEMLEKNHVLDGLSETNQISILNMTDNLSKIKKETKPAKEKPAEKTVKEEDSVAQMSLF